MNKRIMELAEQAFQALNEVTTEGVADRCTFEQAWFQMYNQKFAELIVRECMLAISKTPVMSDTQIETMLKCHDQVEKHFEDEDENPDNDNDYYGEW